NVRRALDEDMIAREQCMVFVDARREILQEFLALVHPARGQIVVGAANGYVAVSQPRAANFLEQVEDHLALPESVQAWAERAQVKSVRSHADEMAGNTVQFADDDADDVRFFRDLHAT